MFSIFIQSRKERVIGPNRQSYTQSYSDLSRALYALQTARRNPSVNIHKDYLGCSTSRYAMVVSERSYQFAGLARQKHSQGEVFNRPSHNRTVFASLLWVMQCVLRFALGRGLDDASDNGRYFSQDATPNRQHQRALDKLSQRAGRPVRVCAPALFRILCKGLSYAQMSELLARLSLSGRARIFGLHSLSSIVNRLFLGTGYECGGWQMPATSTVAGGLWEVQLPNN